MCKQRIDALCFSIVFGESECMICRKNQRISFILAKNGLQITWNMIAYKNMTNKMDGVCERIKIVIPG